MLPSRSGEALPSALTEAMLSGRYAVATDVGGVRDQLGGFGVVVDDATPRAIADGIERAMDTFEEHRRRAEAMRRYAQDRFSSHAMVTEHEALYTSLVERGEASSTSWRDTPARHHAGAMVAGSERAIVICDRGPEALLRID